MSGRIQGPLNNQQVPFSYIQNNGQDYVQRPLRAFEPMDEYDNGDCCGALLDCIRNICLRIWDCIVGIFLAFCPGFDDRADVRRVRAARRDLDEAPAQVNIQLDEAPVQAVAPAAEHDLKPLLKEILAFADNWQKQSYGAKLHHTSPDKDHEDAIKKYLSFVHLRRFEYSDYPPEYSDHYFQQLTERAKLFTMELLKLEQDALATPDKAEKNAKTQRIREALKEVAHAAATGCDPRKATVTFQQWKNVSGRVEIYQILLQHIQDAKLSIFTKRVHGIDRSAWGVHCYNWIYANFGVEFGLCSKTRAEAAIKDGYIRNYSVTSMVEELEKLKPNNGMQFTFRTEFSEQYLFNWMLDAINMDEYHTPYMNALQTHCQEIIEDLNAWNQYVDRRVSKLNITTYVFKPKAIEFFLKSKDKDLDLAIDWNDEFAFESFIHDRLPTSIEEGIRQKDLEEVNLAHLLRLWRTYVK